MRGARGVLLPLNKGGQGDVISVNKSPLYTINGKIFLILFALFSYAIAQPSQEQNTNPTNLESLKFDIGISETKVSETSFISRSIPKITIGANFGAHKIFLFDNQDFNLPYPYSDGYYVLFSWNITNMLSFHKHKRALLELEKTKAAYSLEHDKLESTIRNYELKLAIFEKQISFIKEELESRKNIFELSEMKFNNGEIEFEDFIKSKLSLLSAQKEQNIILLKKQDIVFNLEEHQKLLNKANNQYAARKHKNN